MRRNPIIADVFTRLNYMERRGSGFKKIIEDYQYQYRYTDALAPVFRSQHGSFFLTLKNLNYGLNTGETKGEIKGEINNQSKIEQELLAILKENPKITIAKLTEETGLSKKQIENSFTKLKKKGYLIRKGSNKTGSWIVVDE